MAEPMKKIRCVVYTRKSSDEGLEQAFNSLDAQREAGAAYIASQKHEGWEYIPTEYDDGGYSGGTTERPSLKQLLADITAKKIDVIVVYKVDRLSRSLSDFAQMMNLFDRHNVSFVSVTQQFNTTTSMGRLTLNILLSFAQFEREVTSERIRDKITASKKKGMWMGGPPPLGYDVRERNLVINEKEGEIIKRIFTGYLENRSPLELSKLFAREGITNKHWQTQEGNVVGGGKITVSHINKILRNVVYAGKVKHRDEIYPGQHQAIIEEDLWDRVQAAIDKQDRENTVQWKSEFLLKGKLKTEDGYIITPTATNRKRAGRPTRKVRYYVSTKAMGQGYSNCQIKTLNANFLEELITAHLLHYLHRTHEKIYYHLNQFTDMAERNLLVRNMIDVILVGPEKISINLDKTNLVSLSNKLASCNSKIECVPKVMLEPDILESENNISLVLHIQIKRQKGRRIVLSKEGKDLVLPAQAKPDSVLVQAIGRGFGWKQSLAQNADLTIKALAKQCGYTDRYLSRHLALTGLAPDILHRVLTGNIPSAISLQDLMEASEYLSWERQRTHLGLSQA